MTPAICPESASTNIISPFEELGRRMRPPPWCDMVLPRRQREGGSLILAEVDRNPGQTDPSGMASRFSWYMLRK